MPNARGNAMTATTWQDNHSGLRRHKLMTKELGDTIPALGANENVEDYDDVLAPAKLFSPYSNWTWYVTEWDAETGLCFGLVEGFETELGYFSLDELAEATVFGSVPAVERDLYWKPMTLGEIGGEDGGMSRFAPKTLRRMPPATREIARLANELASVQTRSPTASTGW